MHRVVTVLHEHAAPVAELHFDGDTAAWTQAIDVFSTFLPRRHIGRTTVPGDDLSLLEVDMNRVIPAPAAVFQGPDFTGSDISAPPRSGQSSRRAFDCCPS